jgi:xylose isomerase
MRSYLLYKEKAKRWNEDKEIQALIREVQDVPLAGLPVSTAYSRATADALKAASFDRKALGLRGLKYERLDQLTIEVLLGVR